MQHLRPYGTALPHEVLQRVGLQLALPPACPPASTTPPLPWMPVYASTPQAEDGGFRVLLADRVPVTSRLFLGRLRLVPATRGLAARSRLLPRALPAQAAEPRHREEVHAAGSGRRVVALMALRLPDAATVRLLSVSLAALGSRHCGRLLERRALQRPAPQSSVHVRVDVQGGHGPLALETPHPGNRTGETEGHSPPWRPTPCVAPELRDPHSGKRQDARGPGGAQSMPHIFRPQPAALMPREARSEGESPKGKSSFIF